MEVTKEDLRELIKKIDMNIEGLQNKDINPEDRINTTTLGLISLKHHIENNIHKVSN